MATAKRRAHSKRTQAAAPEKVQQPTSIDTPPAHTPGPWTYEKNSGAFIVTHDSGGMPTIVADVCNYASRGEANVRLIAAAPDLLAACQEALEILEILDCVGENPREKRCIKQLRAAIAKAMRVRKATGKDGGQL